MNIDISVLLVTGGQRNGSSDKLDSVEVLSAEGVPMDCSVPPLPAPRALHTQDGLESCGGSSSKTSCVALSLTAGGWEVSRQLQQPRHGHSSWRSLMGGVLLIGGAAGSASTTTEMLSPTDSSTSASIKLLYETQ